MEADEFTCGDCGQLVAAPIVPDHRLCGMCVHYPGWFNEPQMCVMFHERKESETRQRHQGKAVVRPWLAENCTFKQQTVVLLAMRGCDGLPKNDPSKKIVRKYRSVVLYPAYVNIGAREGDNFIKTLLTGEDVNLFVDNPDHYPLHWYTHFMHGCEIVGFKHPDREIGVWWLKLYVAMCSSLHVNPERLEQLDDRLSDPEEWWPLKEDLVTRDDV